MILNRHSKIPNTKKEKLYSEKKIKKSQYEGQNTKDVRRKEDWKDITVSALSSAAPLAVLGGSFGGKKGAIIGGLSGATSGAFMPTALAIHRRKHNKKHNKSLGSEPRKPHELNVDEKKQKTAAGILTAGTAGLGGYYGSQMMPKERAAADIINDALFKAPLKKEPINDPEHLLKGKKPGIFRNLKEKIKNNITTTKPKSIPLEDKIKLAQYVTAMKSKYGEVEGTKRILREVEKSEVGKKIIKKKRIKAGLTGAAILGLPTAAESIRTINKRKRLQKAYEKDLNEAKEERGERNYSLTDEEKQYNKEVRSRKSQKKGLDGLNGLAAFGLAAGLFQGNSNAKDNVILDIKDKVEKKKQKHLDKYTNQLKKVSKALALDNEEIKLADDILKAAKEREDAKTILAANRLYKKASKKINKKTALVGAGILVPSVTYGTIKRHKKDEALKKKEPNKK